MTRKVTDRIRLYFCPDCGVLVSCTRKTRRHPGRVCQPGKCVDYTQCKLRHVYHNIQVVKAVLADLEKRRRFYKKFDLHKILCSKCQLLYIKYGIAKT